MKWLRLDELTKLTRFVRVGLRSVRAAGRAQLTLTWLLAALNGLLPVARLVSIATMVSAVPGVVRDGAASAAGDRLVAAAAAFVVIIAVSGLARPIIAATSERLCRHVDGRIRERVMTAVLLLQSSSFLADTSVREVVDNARAAAPITGMTPGRLAALLPGVLGPRLTVVGLVAGLSVVDWRLGVLFALLNLKSQDEMQKAVGRLLLGRGMAPPTLDYQLELLTTAGPAKELRVFGFARWLLDRYSTGMQSHMRSAWSAQQDFPPSLIALLGLTAVVDVVALVVLATGATRGDVSIAELSFGVMAIMSLNPSGALSQDDLMMTFAVDAIDRVDALEAQVQNHRTKREAPGEPVPGGPLVVRFEQVSFRYPGSDHEVLCDLDLELRAGERVALVGANGAGKTTLVRLLCGLDEPSAGRVLVNGTDLSSLDMAAWRRELGVVFQDFARYQLSARDNLRYGAAHWQPPSLQQELEAVAALTGVRSRIESLPLSWDSPLAPDFTGGANLSGGEWQRLVLARALLRVRSGGRVLVLDEPTASLDVRGEAEMFDLLLGATGPGSGAGGDDLLTVFVSHRFSTVRRAERVLVLDRGRIIEDGSHADLVAARGLYAQMFSAQAEQFTRAAVGKAEA